MLVFTDRRHFRSRVTTLGEHGPERGELDRIAERRAGTVGLDVVQPARARRRRA